MILIFLGFITILSDTPDSLVFIYTANYKLQKVDGFLKFELDDGGVDLPQGYPELPFAVYHIWLPDKGGRVDFTVLERDFERGQAPVVQDIFRKKPFKKVDYRPPPVEMKVFGKRVKKGEIIISPFVKAASGVEIRKKILVKIYMKGRWFRNRFRTPIKFLNKPRGRFVSFHKKELPTKTGMWIKLKFIQEGVYRIDGELLRSAGVNPELVDPEKIEIRSGYRRVFKFNLPFYDSLPDSLDKIPAIYHTINHNGRFDSSEYILFYGNSLKGFDKNTFKRFNDYNPREWTDIYMRFYNNPYTDTNVYWLKLDGNPKKMLELSSGEGDYVNTFSDTLHLEKDSINFARSGLAWEWDYFVIPSEVNSISKTFNASGVASPSFTLRVGFYTIISGQVHNLTIGLNDVDTTFQVMSPIAFYSERLVPEASFSGGLLSGENTFNFSITTDKDEVYLDFFEVIYKRLISDIHNDRLFFPDSSERIIKTDERLLSLGIDDPYNPVVLKYIPEKGGYYYNGRGVFLCDSFLTPLKAEVSSPFSLLGGGADWVCISGDLLLNQAKTLGDWRKDHLRGFPNPVVKVIPVSEVYDNFSYGVADPGAIKRFILYASEHWSPPPSYVLLFGKGTYDYRNLTEQTRSENIVPIHTNGADVGIFTLLSRNPTDDVWFVDIDGDTKPDIPIGRVTATSQEEAKEWVNKLIEYESQAGFWRQKYIILADDEYTSTSNNELIHTRDAENLTHYIPEWLRPEKVYMVLYPFSGNEKPGAKSAFIKKFNDGAVLGYFFGHGNIYQLTHEKVFTLEDISLLKNWRKCPFFFFATCNSGYFERPGERSLGDYFTLYPDGGTIVSIAATRATYPGANYALARTIMSNIVSSNTVGDAYTIGLNSYGDTTYTLFGDPATSLFRDTLDINVEIPDSVLGNREFTINLSQSLDRIYLLVSEAGRDTTYVSPSGGQITFNLPGSVVFKNKYVNTREVKFTVPFNVKQGWGKALLYGISKNGELRKKIDLYLKPSQPVENNPPEVEIISNGRKLEDYSLINGSGVFTIKFQDESGIDIRKKQNLSIFLNSYAEPMYIADKVEYETGTYRDGFVNVNYEFNNKPGDTVFVDVYALDNAGNVGRRFIKLIIAPEDYMWGVYNFPNPMTEKTTFIFHTLRAERVEISIFSVSGKSVWRKRIDCMPGTNYIYWDGRDAYGRRLGNGVYFYVLSSGGKKIIKKLVIAR